MSSHLPDPVLPFMDDLTSPDGKTRNRSWQQADSMLRPRLMHFLLKKDVDVKTAEDLTQQVFLELQKSLAGSPVNDSSQLWPRMFLIAQRRFFDHLRYRRRHPVDAYAEPPEPKNDPAIEPGLLADADVLTGCIQKLKEELRELIVQHYWDDIKQIDLAKSNHMPEGTVYYKLSTARSLLKACVEASRSRP